MAKLGAQLKQLVAPLLFERNTIKFTREIAYEIFENGLEISYYSERQSRSDRRTAVRAH